MTEYPWPVEALVRWAMRSRFNRAIVLTSAFVFFAAMCTLTLWMWGLR